MSSLCFEWANKYSVPILRFSYVIVIKILLVRVSDDSWGNFNVLLIVKGLFEVGWNEESFSCIGQVGDRESDDKESNDGDADKAKRTGVSCTSHTQHGNKDCEKDGDDVGIESVEAVDCLTVVVEFAIVCQVLAVSSRLAIRQASKESICISVFPD